MRSLVDMLSRYQETHQNEHNAVPYEYELPFACPYRNDQRNPTHIPRHVDLGHNSTEDPPNKTLWVSDISYFGYPYNEAESRESLHTQLHVHVANRIFIASTRARRGRRNDHLIDTDLNHRRGHLSDHIKRRQHFPLGHRHQLCR